MSYNPLYTLVQNAYKATKGRDWAGQTKELRDNIGKDKYQEKVSEFFSRMCSKADSAYANEHQTTAWDSLEELLRKVTKDLRNKDLDAELNAIHGKQATEKHLALKGMFEDQEIQRILGVTMEKILRNQNKIKNRGDRADEIMRKGNKELMDQAGQKMSQAAYYPETAWVINIMDFIFRGIEAVGVLLELDNPEISAAEEEPEQGQGGQAPMFLPPVAAPPRPAGPH